MTPFRPKQNDEESAERPSAKFFFVLTDKKKLMGILPSLITFEELRVMPGTVTAIL